MDVAVTGMASGAVAGLVVDLALFPLDTLKTRLQSKEGFSKSGGFRNIYKGIGAAAAGSVPGGALFFLTYDSVKHYSGENNIRTQVGAAACGEVAACLVRVPVEMMKQQTQVGKYRNFILAFMGIGKSQGFSALYNGYTVTVCREIPFGAIQYPIYEKMKKNFGGSQLGLMFSGSVSGGIAAALTTPLDVAKTRIMLQQTNDRNFCRVMLAIAKSEGFLALFSGVSPRVTWMSIGGALFLGSYEATKKIIGKQS